jgi:hypothetical protein
MENGRYIVANKRQFDTILALSWRKETTVKLLVSRRLIVSLI